MDKLFVYLDAIHGYVLQHAEANYWADDLGEIEVFERCFKELLVDPYDKNTVL